MERILAHKANYLADSGHEVLIVTTEQESRPLVFPLSDKVRCTDLGIGYERNNGGPFLSKLLGYPAKKIKHRRELSRLLMAEKPDVTVSMFCGDEGFLPFIKDGSKKILEVHFSRYKRLQYGRRGLWALADRFLSYLDERQILRFDRFVALTEEDLGYWGRPSNGVCIPNFLDAIPEEVSPLDSKVVLSVGRFCFQKGYERLISAWEIVKKNPVSEGWKLLLVGGGEDVDSLRSEVNSRQLGDSVQIHGPSSDIASYYAGASIFALSSRFEGLPMVLLEAQAWGLPIVSFDCKCGPRDVITDGVDGFLVPEGDIAALAEKIVYLMKQPRLLHEMGQKARGNASRWDKNEIMRQWTDLFASI